MALNKIKTGSITDDAVNSDKLAAGSVTNTELNKTAITGQTELSETANDGDFTIIFDTSASALKKVLRSNLKQQGPTVSSVSPTNALESAGPNITFTITGSGFTAGSTARLIGNTGKVQEFDTVTRASATSITGVIAFSSLEQAQEPYDVQVTNGEGIASLLANQINVDASPVFVTAAGSLGTFLNGQRTGISVSVNATDADSVGNVTFELQSGSLPAGLSLSNSSAEGGTAIISGNASAVGTDTTSNFVLRAVDNASNTTSRSFSITINAPVSQSFTSSGTFSVPSGLTQVDVLVVAGGGGGGAGQTYRTAGGGGGAGGLIFMPAFPLTPGGTVAVTVGCGGGSQPMPSGGGITGQDSVFGATPSPGLGQGGVLTAKGGGGGIVSYRPADEGAGGSGGGGGTNLGTSGSGAATQPTQPGNSGAYGFGNNGGTGVAYSHQSTGTPAAGGGGGAGAVGGNSGGNGGVGKAYTIADGTTSVYYAGGGGAGMSSSTGGQGGAGNGGDYPGGNGQSGQANKGGGAGGSASQNAGCRQGGTGGKGIVIVRY